MNDKPKLTEAQIHGIYAQASMASLLPHLYGETGYVSVLSNNRITTFKFDGVMGITLDFTGTQFEGSINDLVRKKAIDPECIGLVPIFEEAKKAIKKLGLTDTLEGDDIPALEFRALMYLVK